MGKSAVIIADEANGSQSVYGIPAVRRIALLARRFGFERIHVISRDPAVAPIVSDLVGPHAFHPFSTPSELSRVVEGLGFNEQESILLLKANHVIDRWSLDRLLQSSEGREVCLLEDDRRNADIPIFLVHASRLPSLVTSLTSGQKREAADWAGAAHVKAGAGLPRLVDRDPSSVRAAEAALIAAVGEATRERDSFLSRHVSRRLSRLISPSVARAGITANAATVCNTIIGLAGAFLLFMGGYPLQLAGSLLFLLSIILDGVDGEVARLTLKESSFGHYLDVICDNVVHVAIFCGMALGLYRHSANPFFLYVLCFLMGGFGLCALVINGLLNDPDAPPSRTRELLEGLFNNRDFAYLVTAFALFSRLDWFLVAATFGTYILAATLWATKLMSRSPKGRLQSGDAP